MFLGEKKMSWSERAGRWFCFICVGIGIFLIIKYALGIFLPFLIAWGLAILTAPLSKKLAKAFGISRKFCSFLLTFLLIGTVAGLLFFAVNRLIFEAERLFVRLSEDSERIGALIGNFFDRLSSLDEKRLPILESLLKIEQFRQFWDNIDEVVTDAIGGAISTLTQWIPGALIDLLGRLPEVLIFLLITVISCFYFSADIDRINRQAVSLLPKRIRQNVHSIKITVIQKLSGYVRAYILLLLLTFGELFVGFLMLGVPYPLLLAVLIALLDILPIFGVGTALIPWALIEILFSKDYYTSIGLFIIYAIITIVRQITEPKIVGGTLGLPPLVTLIAMYTGLNLFGFLGIIIGPLLALLIVSAKDFTALDASVDTKRGM